MWKEIEDLVTNLSFTISCCWPLNCLTWFYSDSVLTNYYYSNLPIEEEDRKKDSLSSFCKCVLCDFTDWLWYRYHKYSIYSIFWSVSLTEIVPVWRRVGFPQAGSRSVGRSYTHPGTAPAWYARHDSGLSFAASLSFLLTDRDSWWENSEVKEKWHRGQRRAVIPHQSMALQGRYSLKKYDTF